MDEGDNRAYGFDEGQNFDHSDNSSHDFGYNEHLKCGISIDRSPGMAATHYISVFVYPILLLHGIVGNLLAIPILISVSKSAWSTVIYLACLAGTDLILLLIRCGSTWYFEVVKVNLSEKIMNSSDAACKAYNFSFMCIEHMNPWLVASISVDMMIATRWPMRTYVMCTLERARYVLLLISILVVCLDINLFWTHGVPKPGYPCLYTEEFSDIFKERIWPVLDNAIGTYLPLATVTICFIITASTMIHRPASLGKDLEAEMKKYFLQLATLRDFRTICFILCLIFICLGIFKIPYNLTMFLVSYGYVDVECVTLEVFNTLNMTFTFLFYGAKIYLYIACSSMFRIKLKQGYFYLSRKLESFCRALCTCGHRWAPIHPRDKCPDRQQQCQNQPLIHNEEANTKSNIDLCPVDKMALKDKNCVSNTANVRDNMDYVDTNCMEQRNCKIPTKYSNNRQQYNLPITETGTKV